MYSAVHSSDGSSFFYSCALRLPRLSTPASSASFVVEALVGQDWALDTSDDSLPLVWLSNLTGSVSVVDKSTSKESACSSTFPHINGGVFASSNFASW